MPHPASVQLEKEFRIKGRLPVSPHPGCWTAPSFVPACAASKVPRGESPSCLGKWQGDSSGTQRRIRPRALLFGPWASSHDGRRVLRRQPVPGYQSSPILPAARSGRGRVCPRDPSAGPGSLPAPPPPPPPPALRPVRARRGTLSLPAPRLRRRGRRPALPGRRGSVPWREGKPPATPSKAHDLLGRVISLHPPRRRPGPSPPGASPRGLEPRGPYFLKSVVRTVIHFSCNTLTLLILQHDTGVSLCLIWLVTSEGHIWGASPTCEAQAGSPWALGL